ncbi:hypothetical protein ABH931_000318 [Streptacidiphilus sp. MAP12-33]|uniref:AfsA-related hotdog domain-containing protein n=1 Tax=Streptacidiphilus sp. MAP12-33 TaxID=3156266 RepID=UPI003512FC33
MPTPTPTPPAPSAPVTTLAAGPAAPASDYLAPLVRHLVHRPRTLEGFLRGSTGVQAQDFGLSAVLPERHPLYGDGPGTHHEPHLPLEALRRATLFVAHRYFRVPAGRPAVFSTSEVTLDPAAAWRRTPGPTHLGLELTLTPVDVVGGVPRGLECRAEIRIDGMPCGTARARLVFLMPKVYQNHRSRGRATSRAGHAAPARDPLTERVAPHVVGRADPANVVVARPRTGAGEETLVAEVVAEPGHPVFAEGSPDHVPVLVLMEASRQLAFLHAGQLQGYPPGSCVLAGWSADFQGFAEPDLALVCESTPRPARRDADGRPLLPLSLRFLQGSRQVGTVEVVVGQDC